MTPDVLWTGLCLGVSADVLCTELCLGVRLFAVFGGCW